MMDELLKLLPSDAGDAGMTIALTGSMIGAAIWLMGARFSRPIITLLTVLIGAVIGLHLPQWFGWTISGAGPAVAMALVLGITGYTLHGVWVGIGLGTVLASWAAIGSWICFHGTTTWTWPPVASDTTVVSYSTSLWQQLTPDVAHILLCATAVAMLSGLAMSILWPKFSLLLGWSLAGATLLAGMGLAAVEFGQPEWLAKVPPQNWAQAAILGALVLIGLLIQWKLTPRPAPAKAGKKKNKSESSQS